VSAERIRDRCARLARGQICGDFQGEGCAITAFHVYVAAVRFHCALDDCKTQSSSWNLFAQLAALEALEDPLPVCRLYSRSGVGN